MDKIINTIISILDWEWNDVNKTLGESFRNEWAIIYWNYERERKILFKTDEWMDEKKAINFSAFKITNWKGIYESRSVHNSNLTLSNQLIEPIPRTNTNTISLQKEKESIVGKVRE